MKSSAYPAISVDNPPYMDCFSPFLQENLDPPLLWFFKNLNPFMNQGGSQYE